MYKCKQCGGETITVDVTGTATIINGIALFNCESMFYDDKDWALCDDCGEESQLIDFRIEEDNKP